jgi:heme a synthase
LRIQADRQTPHLFSVWLHRFAILVAVLTVILLLAGALVTSNEAGDSVPDWPLSFGRWLIGPEHFVANVRYEYSHRFIAGMVGVSTFLLASWIWLTEKRRWVAWLGVIALAGVIAQAVIGGVRVHFPAYKALIAVPHALVAQSFFALIVSIAVFTSESWRQRGDVETERANPRLRRLAAVSVAAVLVQLVLGAGFRHQAFGIEPHVVGAVFATGLIISTSVAALSRRVADSSLKRPAVLALVLIALQIGLGISAYFARLASADDPQPLEPMISLTALHLVIGALTLATLLVLTLRCHRPVGTDQRVRADSGPHRLASSQRRATV